MRRLVFLLSLLAATPLSGKDATQHAILPDSLEAIVASARGADRVRALWAAAEWFAAQQEVVAALKYYDDALEEALRLGDEALVWRVKEGKAKALERHFGFDKALKIWLDLLGQARQQGEPALEVEALLAVGRLHMEMENFKEAEEALQRASSLAKMSANDSLMAATWQALGTLYRRKGMLGQAKQYFKKALDIWIRHRNAEKALELAGLTGELSLRLGDYEGAILHFQVARDLHMQLGDLNGLVEDLYHIAEAQYAQGFLSEALSALDAALQYEAGAPRVRASAWILKARLAETPDEALAYLQKAADLLEKAAVHAELSERWAELSQQFARLGAHDLALDAASRARQALATWYDAERNRAMLEMSRRFATETALKEQQQRIQLLEVEQARSRMFRNMMLLVLVLLALVAVVLWRGYRQKKRDNLLLLEKNAEIEEARAAIEAKNAELEQMNQELEQLNQRLVREIGERESIEKSSFARDRFLAIMSQEMRTPLNIITNLTHQLMAETPRPDQREQLRQLQFAANNLVVFVNDVLDFSRIEAGKLTLDSRPFPVKKLVAEVCEQYQMAAKEQGTKLNLKIDKKIPDWLDGDAGRLNQILSNLMALALDRNAGQTVALDVALHELHPEEAIIRIAMQGEHPILSEKEVAELRAKRTLAELEEMNAFSRSDLSLFITKRLVDLQNGHLEIGESEGRQTLMLFLPYKIAERAVDDTHPPAAGDSFDKAHLAGKRVLLAEDNKINQVVVANLLRNLGMEVFTANNGQEAVEALKEQDFDIVLMDIQMPVMDGYNATMEIRKMDDPRKRDVPIIALTASAFLTEREKARLFGMNDHVGKPFSPEELVEKIGRLLKVHYPG